MEKVPPLLEGRWERMRWWMIPREGRHATTQAQFRKYNGSGWTGLVWCASDRYLMIMACMQFSLCSCSFSFSVLCLLPIPCFSSIPTSRISSTHPNNHHQFSFPSLSPTNSHSPSCLYSPSHPHPIPFSPSASPSHSSPSPQTPSIQKKSSSQSPTPDIITIPSHQSQPTSQRAPG